MSCEFKGVYMIVVEHLDADAEFLFCCEWLTLTGSLYPSSGSIPAYWHCFGGWMAQAG